MTFKTGCWAAYLCSAWKWRSKWNSVEIRIVVYPIVDLTTTGWWTAICFSLIWIKIDSFDLNSIK